NGQAPLFPANLALPPDDLRIDERESLIIDFDNGHSLTTSDLGSGESHSLCSVHCVQHVVSESAQLGCHLRDEFRLLPKNWRAEYVDVEECHDRGSASDGRPGADACNASALDDHSRVAGLDGDTVVHCRRILGLNGHDFANNSAGGDDLIALLERFHQGIVLLALLLLRANENEVEDGEDRAIHENHAAELTAG